MPFAFYLISRLLAISACFAALGALCSEMSSSGTSSATGGYLFAHTTKGNYGRMYYSVSKDGLRWKLLNQGQHIFSDYRGQPDITRGHDGRFYLVGNHSMDPHVLIWSSKDLIQWTHHSTFSPDLTSVPGFKTSIRFVGAPKVFYDETEKVYILTWNSPSLPSAKDDPERFWLSMRTLVVTSPDLVSFSSPRLLFPFDFATIHTIIRRQGTRYYAILKDERVPSFECTTGKSIRISSAPSIDGPWTSPSAPVTPNYREAQSVIRRADGVWLLYYEQYPGVQYELSTAPSLDGPWYARYNGEYAVPPETRHGGMIAITQEEYANLVAAYPPGSR